ncbi:hypothetical protein HDV00_009693 [Rhizophlyctis rosea]|nr:hypothetical protein HDV00_009693 [Rhizophlyctis rosea]
MPKQAAPLQKRPVVKVFHIRDDWVQLYQVATAAPYASSLKDVLAALGAFLNRDPTYSDQLAAIRKLQNSLAKTRKDRSAATETYQLLQTCIIPIFLEVHFAKTLPQESSFRSAVFSVISTAHEVCEEFSTTVISISPTFVKDHLQEHYDRFLEVFTTASVSPEDSAVSHFGAVLLTTLDRPVGRLVVEQSFVGTFGALVQTLDRLTDSVVESTQKIGTMATKLHLAPKFQSCNDLLKVTVGLVTKFPGAMREPVDVSSSAEEVSAKLPVGAALKLGFRICFSNDFMPENQFLAGILIGSLLDHIPSSSWLLVLFGDPSMSNLSTTITADLPADWQTSSDHTYGALSLYRGILSTVSGPTLVDMSYTEPSSSTKTPLLSWMYTRITRACDFSTDANTRVLALQTLATWLSVMCAGLKGAEGDGGLVTLVPTEVCQRLFGYVFDGWEDPIDTIQHKLKDVFQALLDLFEVMTEEVASGELEICLDSLLKADWHRKVKYDLLSAILTRIPPSEVLRLRPDFLLICFDVMRNPMMASRVSAFITKFFKEALSNVKDLTVVDNSWWLKPMVGALTNENHVVRRYVSEVILTSLLKSHKATGTILLSELSKSESEYVTDRGYKLHAIIAVLKAGRLLDSVDLAKTLKEDRDIFDQAISHPDLNLRVDVFGFLSEAQKATADFTDAEFPVLKSCLLLSLDNQSPEFRQRVYGHLQKLLRRVRRTLYANWRDYRSRKDFLDKSQSVEPLPANLEQLNEEAKELLRKIDVKKDFLQWLCDLSVTSIFPGSSFQRGNSNLQLMHTILDSEQYAIDGNTRVDIADLPGYPTIVSERSVQVLLGILSNDSYVPNRQQAFELLMRFPGGLPGLGEGDVRGLLADGVRRATSIRSLDSEIGSTIVRLAFAKYVVNGSMLLDPTPGTSAEQSTEKPAAFFTKNLLNLTKKHVDIGKKNLYLCATEYPMHGLFGTLQAVLSEVKFDSLSVSEDVETWRDLVDLSFDLVKAACDSVLGVCADASPEGNLPASFADMQNNMESLIADAGDDVVVPGEKSNEAQLILYQCFHTIKEATGVLRTIICSAPLPVTKDDERVMVRYERIVEAGNLLRVLLGSIRHRGAFAAVHVCFADVCTTLLSSGRDFLADLPRLWLDDFLDQVVSVNVSITRRSAGLPLGVLAVVSAPVPSRPVLLSSTLDRLFTIGMNDVPEEVDQQLDLPQVHAYNIIRAIFQDAEIATEVREWMGQGFALTIKGFSSPSFPIRNGAAMLFSTLVTKALGTKKSRDESHSINTVTGREFFTRFPNLHSLLLTELRTAVDFLEEGKVHPALYPILTILARHQSVKPSPLESTDPAIAASAFGPVVARCASSSIFKARDMAGRAYAALVTPNKVVETVKALLGQLSLRNQNHLHGALLLVRNLLKAHFAKDVADFEVRKEAIKELAIAFAAVPWVYNANHCPITHELFLTIVREFFIEAQWVQNEEDDNVAELAKLTETHFAAIRTLIWTHCHTSVSAATRFPTIIPIAPYSLRREQALICLHGLVHCDIAENRWIPLALSLLDDVDYEVQLTTIEFIPKLHTMSSRLDFRSILRKLAEISASTDRYYRVPIEAAQILAKFGSGDFGKTVDADLLTNLSSSLMTALKGGEKAHCAEAFLPLLGLIISQTYRTVGTEAAAALAMEFASLIQLWSGDEQPLSTRIAVTEALRQLDLSSTVIHFPKSILVAFAMTLIKLMEDDDSDVREDAARVAAIDLLLFKEPVTASKCRVLLVLKVAEAWAETEEDVEGLLQMLLGNNGLCLFQMHCTGENLISCHEPL